MRMFADTSAIIKLVLDEPYSTDLRQLLAPTDTTVVVCRITWAEAFAGLSRRARTDPANETAIERAKHSVKDLWQYFTIVEVSQSLVESAGELAEAFGLRAYDSVQLAAASMLAKALDEPLVFACFDRRLNIAARLLEMDVPFAKSP